MGYFATLAKAADWIASAQNKNKGWGMSPEQASSIVNTAEAIYVLTRANKYPVKIAEGLKFIEAKLFPAIDKSGPRTRYVFFALLAAYDHLDIVDAGLVERCVTWLMKARNADGAWGHNANDGESRLYPTCFSVWMLSKFGVPTDQLKSAVHWIRNKQNESGWSFEAGKPNTPAATSLAVLALRTDPEYNVNTLTTSKEYLLETAHWNNERENLPGTLWDHCTYMWLFPALISLDVNPYAPTIAQGVRFINRLVGDHGWSEPFGGMTVRGQFWAVYGFDALHRAFDPAIHVYRIDSERVQPTLSEPEFVNIMVRGRLAMVVPRIVYQFVGYALLLASGVAFFGIQRILNTLPRWTDFGLAVLFFLSSYVLVSKRQTLFPRWLLPMILGLAAVLSFVDLVFGASVWDLFNKWEKFSWNQQ